MGVDSSGVLGNGTGTNVLKFEQCGGVLRGLALVSSMVDLLKKPTSKLKLFMGGGVANEAEDRLRTEIHQAPF